MGKGLADDGLGDKVYLIIDGVDARVHYLEMHAKLVPDEARIGAILAVGRDASGRSVDKTIAAYAARNDGFYEPREHAEILRATGHIPGGDIEGHVEAHVRRLEALRRAGILSTGRSPSRPPLGSITSSSAAIASKSRRWAPALRLNGRCSSAQQELIAMGLAQRLDDGRIRYQADLLATLQRREVERAGQYLAAKHMDGSLYVPARDGAMVQGTYSHAIMLASGKFAVIERNAHVTLVP